MIRSTVLVRVALATLIAGFLLLPLRDILTYPGRVSVLPNLQTDAAAYYGLGSRLAETHSLSALPPRHPPGWITTLAIAFTLAGTSYVTGKLVLWLALIACVGGSGWLADRMYGRAAAWIAALICAASPALRAYVGTVQYEVFTGALLIGVVILAVRTVDSESAAIVYRRALWTGVVGAALILTRETFAVVVPLIAFWIAFRLRSGQGSQLRSGHAHGATRHSGQPRGITVAVLVTTIALAPAVAWTVVQSLRFRQFVTISEKGPIVIELGHNTRANGTYNAPLVGIGQPTGLAFVRQYPARAAVLSVRKILYFWGVLRDGWNVPRPSAVWLWRATTGLVPLEWLAAWARGGWLLFFFLIALWQLGRHGLARWWAVPATVLLIMVVHIVTLSSHRFAVTTLPLVFALISGPLLRLVRAGATAFSSGAVRTAALLLLAVIGAMQFQYWPLHRRLEAAGLDGLEADNRVDAVAGREVRVADAARGVRPVALLTDEYLPRGVIRLTVRARRLSENDSVEASVINFSLVDLDGQPACTRNVSVSELQRGAFTPVMAICPLPSDTVATIAIVALGTVDVAIEELSLDWLPPQ